MNGDEARQAERDKALAGDPKAQDRFRRLSNAMHKVAELDPPSMSWDEFGLLVGASRNGVNSWKTYLRMAKRWSVFPIPPHTSDTVGISVQLSQASLIPSASKASSTSMDGGGDDASFKLAEVLPVVFRLITDRTCKSGAFVTHDQIVAALLDDFDGAVLVQAANSKNGSARKAIASNMVAWFSTNYTTGKNEYEKHLEQMKIAGKWAYRSLQATSTGVAADEDVVYALEGKPLLVSHLKRERSSKLRDQKLASVLVKAGKLACEACGFETSKRFPELANELLEVHHRSPLAAAAGPVKVTLDDLALLCPTCHRAIHRSDDMSVEAFNARYFR